MEKRMPISLKPHQLKVVNYMKSSNARGIILYHGLGSGKTITSIAISKLYPKKVLIIVPASMRTQWISELQKMNVNINNYKLTSYEGFLSSVESGKIKNLKEQTVIIDEAHRIRSATGKTSTILVKLLQSAYKVILLTGTPMVNSPIDLSPLVNAVEGTDLLPVNEKQFREKFYILQSKTPPPLEKRCRQYSTITCCDQGLMYKDGLCNYHYLLSLKKKYQKETITKKDLRGARDLKEWMKTQKNRIDGARSRAKLGILKPNTSEYSKYVSQLISYYRPKENIRDFPSVIYKTIKVPMTAEQYKIYTKAQKKVNKTDLDLLKLGTEVTRKSSAMNAFLNATRQISNTWDGHLNTPKLLKILRVIKKEPKPALVYSNWIDNGIVPLGKMLQESNLSHLVFTGGMSDHKKQAVVTNFNQGKIDVLLLSSSGGEGLDLKNTRQIHIMEPHWNEAKISQVIGRGIRYKSHESLALGQRKVSVYYWISTPLGTKDMGTDEYLYQISQKKLEEMKLFLETAIKNSVEYSGNKKETVKKLTNLRKKEKSLKKKIGGCPFCHIY